MSGGAGNGKAQRNPKSSSQPMKFEYSSKSNEVWRDYISIESLTLA